MDQEVIVTRVEGDHAYVEVGATGCGHCHETGGCQSGILGQIFSRKPRQFRIANRIGAEPGERVVVRLADGETLRAALLTYVLPVLSLLLGAIAGTALGEAGNNDASAALGALAGLAGGVLAGLTLRRSRIGKITEPVIIRRSSSSFCLSKESCQ